MRHFTVRAALIAAVLGTAGIANAAIQYDINSGPILLSNLAGTGNSILVGDKIFDNFTYSHTGDMPDAAHVNITPEITTRNSEPVWGFQLEGLFTDSNSPGGSDAVLNYRVTVVDPNSFLITDIHINGDTDVVGTGFAKVTKTWTPDAGSQKVRIYDIEPGNVTQLNDSILLDVPVASLNVSKNISASIGDGSIGSNATVTSIDQLYSQTPGGGGGVPEPASLGVLGLGIVGLVARRRR